MDSFIKRNMPIFVIGFIVLFGFIIIIILSQTSTNKELKSNIPTLIKIQKEPESKLKDSNSTENTDKDNRQPPPPEVTGELTPKQKERKETLLEQATLSKEEVIKNYGAVDINFTQEGFEPKSTTLYKWQTVRFINTTDKPIAIKQTSPRYDEFVNEVFIGAGDTLEFEISKERLWTFMEVTSKSHGSIFANVAKNIF